MNTRGVAAMLIAAALLLLAGPAPAATIFSTFGPGYSFDRNTYTPVNFYTAPETIGTSLAYRFEVPVNADYRLSEVRIAASWAGTKKNALFLIAADAGGVPSGAAFYTLADNPDALTGFPEVVSLPAPDPLVLSAGQPYWLIVQPSSLDSSAPANDFVELWLNPDSTALQTSRTWFFPGPWTDWFNPPIVVQAAAFSIEATVVPLPGSLVLLVSGLLPMWFSPRRRADS